MYFKRKYADTFNEKGKILKAPKTRELHSLSVMIKKPQNKHINAVLYFIDENLRTLGGSVKSNQNISELDETVFSFAEPIKVHKNKEYYVEVKYFPGTKIPKPAKNISELGSAFSSYSNRIANT